MKRLWRRVADWLLAKVATLVHTIGHALGRGLVAGLWDGVLKWAES